MKDILETFKKPSAEILAQRELEDNKRSLLETERNREYYTQLATFYRNRINHLKVTLQKAADEVESA